MIRVRSGSLWVRHRKGSWRRIPWKTFLLMPALMLITLTGIILSANRTEPILAWLVADVPQGKEFFWQLIEQQSRVAFQNVLQLEQPLVTSDLPTIDIFVGDGVMHQMLRAKMDGDRELGREPGGDRPYFPAYFIDESEKVQKARIGLRGWGYQHHSPRKPSLRVRIRKDDVALGRRFVELQRPEEIVGFVNYLPEDLAVEIGVMTAVSDYVRLFFNRKYKGVYLRSYRPGEALTLALGRLPGPYFKGDALGSYRGEDLWAGHESWRIFERTEQGVRFLDALLAHISEPESVAARVRLEDFVNSEAYARWQALMTVMGSAHTDDFHNQVLFLDPMTGLFEPVLWDVNGLGAGLSAQANPDRVPNRLIGRLMRDPRWTHRRNQWMYQLITNQCEPKAFRERVESLMRKLVPDLKADPYLADNVGTPVDGIATFEPLPVSVVDQLDDGTWQYMDQRAAFLTSYLSRTNFTVEPTDDGSSLVTVFGNVAVRVLTPTGERILYPGQARGEDVVAESVVTSGEERKPAPLSYSLPHPPSELQFQNAITDAVTQPLNSEPPRLEPELTCFRAEDFPPLSTGEIVLGPGPVHITEDIYIAKSQSLTVRPGTELLIDPGRSIICEGPAKLVGRPESPIKIRPAKEAPWGVLSLVGPNTKGSRLMHVDMEGGSFAAYRGIEFKGMFNVYRCGDIKLEKCRFGKNEISDDAVNIADSSFTVADCLWEGARSDGFDSDMSTGTITGTIFSKTGNDGLDLMTSEVTVLDCQFTDCGDKGVSVGEGSQALIVNGKFSSCVIGSQVKDASRAAFLKCEFLDCDKALDAYRKKWLYRSGGHILLDGCLFSGTKKQELTIDRRSSALVVDDRLEGAESVTRTEMPAEWRELLDDR